MMCQRLCLVIISFIFCGGSKFVYSEWVEIPQSTNKQTSFSLGVPTSFPPTLEPPVTTTQITEPEEEEITNNASTPNEFSSLLTNIQNTLIDSSKKTLKSKISVLRNLRDSLLSNIDQQMMNLWQPRRQVEARGHHEDDYQMDFPSNEGALMTIGFLTFAVFLIKLVLKLIQALKNKSNGMMVVTTMAPMTAAILGRKKRQTDEATKILQLIEEYNFN